MVKQYLLGEVLGKGSYGKVREALDTNTLRVVAVKIVKKQLLRKLPGDGEAAVQQEIDVIKGLDHPHVVSYVESFVNEEKGKLYVLSPIGHYPHYHCPSCVIHLLND